MDEPTVSDADTATETLIEHSVLQSQHNVLITGAGGCGKSTLIRKITVKGLLIGKHIYITAATGVAAVVIGGQTLHRFFGVGLAKGPVERVINYVKKNPGAIKRLKETEILFIDEISMIGAELFDKLDKVAQYFRDNSKPFGGMKLVLSGDFLQLPPINDKWVFQSAVWDDLNILPHILTEPRRFTDLGFYETLMRARLGKLDVNDVKKLRQRRRAYKDYLEAGEPGDIKPTVLYSHRIDVERANNKKLEELPNKISIYKACDLFTPLKPRSKLEYYAELLEHRAPKKLALKLGAQVMLTWNLDVEAGLCNGSRGVVVELGLETIKVKFRNGETIDIARINFEYKDERAEIVRHQFPLILAFACTIHKAQGSTIDFCVIDVGTSIFSPGQAYVALSRARSWDSVLLSSLRSQSFQADSEALAFMGSLTVPLESQTVETTE